MVTGRCLRGHATASEQSPAKMTVGDVPADQARCMDVVQIPGKSSKRYGASRSSGSCKRAPDQATCVRGTAKRSVLPVSTTAQQDRAGEQTEGPRARVILKNSTACVMTRPADRSSDPRSHPARGGAQGADVASQCPIAGMRGLGRCQPLGGCVQASQNRTQGRATGAAETRRERVLTHASE